MDIRLNPYTPPATGRSAEIPIVLLWARAVAYCGAIAGMVMTAGLTLSVSPQRRLLTSVLGGTLSVTPYILARAIEAVVRDQQELS